MTPERWRRIEELFHAADALPPEARASFLDRECASDRELRAEVDALLGASSRTLQPLEHAIGAAADEALSAGSSAVAGRRVGAYRLERLLGRGGMGAVYLAVHEGAYTRQVALKMLPHGLETDHAVARFAHERQILAALEHPNIARLLDGGSTPDGIPYIAMEYVEGRPLLEHCEAHRLSIDARLRLFGHLCSAVEHAHQQLVVHRDLKPGNILVTAEGQLKLLDFGIAKLLEQDQGEALVTRTGLRLMTPEYASPEQVRGQAVSTATDVYGLGLVLHELLCGVRAQRLATEDPLELHRVICEETPARPSVVAPALARRLRGDLDTIVLTALQKEPQRRYRSVAQLSEDVRRHLEGLPVRARKDTVAYRLGKFLRRNRLPVAAGLLVLASLTAGIVSSTRSAALAARRFAEVRHLAGSFLFEFHDAIQHLPGSTTARELVVRKALEYLEAMSKESGTDPELRRELAWAYLKVGDVQGGPAGPNLGRREDAARSYDKALALLGAPAADTSTALATLEALAEAYLRKATLLQLTGPAEEGLATLERMRAVVERMHGAAPAARARLQTVSAWRLAFSHHGVGHTRAAQRLAEQAIAHARAWVALGRSAEARYQLGVSLTILASALADGGRAREAVAPLLEAKASYEALRAEDPTQARYPREIYYCLFRLGYLRVHWPIERIVPAKDAEAWMRAAVALAEEIHRRDPRDARGTLDWVDAREVLARIVLQRSPAEALAILEALLATPEVLEAEASRDRRVTTLHAEILHALHRSAAARKAVERGRELAAKLPETELDGEISELVALLRVGAALHEEAGDLAAAEADLVRARDLAERLAGPKAEDLPAQQLRADVHRALAAFWTRRGNAAKACAAGRHEVQVWQAWQKGMGPGPIDEARLAEATAAVQSCP